MTRRSFLSSLVAVPMAAVNIVAVVKSPSPAPDIPFWVFDQLKMIEKKMDESIDWGKSPIGRMTIYERWIEEQKADSDWRFGQFE